MRFSFTHALRKLRYALLVLLLGRLFLINLLENDVWTKGSAKTLKYEKVMNYILLFMRHFKILLVC